LSHDEFLAKIFPLKEHFEHRCSATIAVMNTAPRMPSEAPAKTGVMARPGMTARQGLRLGLIGLGTSVVPLDSAVNIAFPDITGSFGLPIEMIQWVVICYVLTHASLMLAFGRLGDVFGYGRVFRAGLLWNAVAFVCCAAAPSFGWLLFCRFLQGIGAALILSCAPALVTGLFPEDRRSRALAAFTMMYALGSAGGPLLGGELVDLWGWPAVFWFRAPIAVIALVFLEGLPAAPRRGRREPVDIVGAGLLALAISTLLLTLNQLQHPGRQLFALIAFSGIAAASFFGFVRWERRVAQPIVNLDFFRIGNFAAINGASVLVYLTSFSVLLFAPYYLVRFSDLPLPLAGAVLAVSFAGSIAASPLAGRLIERFPAARIAALGAVLNGAGLSLIGGWGVGTTVSLVAAPLVLQGFGVGLFQVAYMDLVMGTLPPQYRGVAGSLAMLTRTLGVVTGATLLTLVFHSLQTSSLAYQGGGADGFLSAYRVTFRLAGIVSAVIGFAVVYLARWRVR
jgi:EmrB/QacA subfamily drug resistance transporter